MPFPIYSPHGADIADTLHLLDGSGAVVVLCFLTWLFLRCAVGWGSDQGIGGFGEEPGIKAQLTNLIRSVRTVMRVPLIAVNSVTIVLLLLFG
uniref:Immediate early response 3-interacting protein 1 n=1 Tax=Meleagris gallopavo TaxID=9103 RepID=A0A803Y564_MELGA